MRADTAWDVAESAASRCSAHKTVGARADAAAIDVSRKKCRRDVAELITFFIVQPCDGARRRASVGRRPHRSRTLQPRCYSISPHPVFAPVVFAQDLADLLRKAPVSARLQLVAAYRRLRPMQVRALFGRLLPSGQSGRPSFMRRSRPDCRLCLSEIK